MQVKSPYCRMLQREHSAIFLTFIKLPFSIKTFFFCLFSSGRLRQVCCKYQNLIILLTFIYRLECRVDAYTPPQVTWFVNGMEIKPSPHYEMLYEDGKSVLLIIEVGPEDTGEYTMKAASDEIGEIVSSTTLYVQGRCPFNNL